MTIIFNKIKNKQTKNKGIHRLLCAWAGPILTSLWAGCKIIVISMQFTFYIALPQIA